MSKKKNHVQLNKEKKKIKGRKRRRQHPLGMVNFPRPSPLCLTQVFLALQRLWGGDGAKFQPRTTGWGENEFRLFRPTSSRPSPSPPRLVLLKVIIVKFSYLKTLLFKQTYQYQLILFYQMWFSAFILLCVIL